MSIHKDIPGHTLREKSLQETKRPRFTGRQPGGKSASRPADLSSPKPGHTTGGSRRGARRCGGAGSGRTVCQQNCSPRKQSSLSLSKVLKTRRLNVSPEARTSEILSKPMEEQSPRLTTGSSAVYQRDEKRSFLLAAGQWNDAFSSL